MGKPFFLLLLFFSFNVQAQKTGLALVDSLVAALPKAADDTVKARLYNRIFNELSFISTDRAMQYAYIGLAHSERMKWSKGIAVFHSNIARVYSDKGNYDSAITYYKKALVVHEKAGDKVNMTSVYNNMAVAAQNIRSDYTGAVDYYFKSLQLAEEIKDTIQIAAALQNIAVIYLTQKNYQKALDFANRALVFREAKGLADEIAGTQVTIGSIYNAQNDTATAGKFYNKALAIYRSTGNKAGLALVLSDISITFDKDYRRKIEYALEAKKLYDEINPYDIRAINNISNLGIAYFDVVRYDTNHTVKYGDVIPVDKNKLLQTAEGYLKQVIILGEQSGQEDYRSYAMGYLAEVQAYKGDYKNAYLNFRDFQQVQDSIFSQENKNKIAAIESQREIDKKNDQIKINQLALANQRKTLWGLVAGITLLAVIGGLLYRQNAIRKRSNLALQQLNIELDEANKVKARFFGILSHDLRSPVANLVNFLHLQKEAPDLLDKETQAAHAAKMSMAAENLLDTMEALLLWSKGQMDNFKPQVKNVAVKDIFESIKTAFASSENIQFGFINDGDLQLSTDENYLKTIVYNLTVNAVKALKDTPAAAIQWKAWQEGKQRLLSISDNGPGTTKEQLSALFDEQAAVSSKNGLGLHIIRDMAKAINCSISFETRAKKGTVFKLRF
ncbi:MAG: tetratricopeptide repeat protein [Ferruginibacter sp.]